LPLVDHLDNRKIIINLAIWTGDFQDFTVNASLPVGPFYLGVGSTCTIVELPAVMGNLPGLAP